VYCLESLTTTASLGGEVLVEYAATLLGIGNTGCIFRRGNSIFCDNKRLIATEEG
jgi:hypothetical protein